MHHPGRRARLGSGLRSIHSDDGTRVMHGKDRRAFQRYPADLPAEALVAGSSARWPCRIRDFCAEGMLLESAADDPFQRPGGLTARQPLRLQLTVGEGRNPQRFVLSGRVAHVNGRKAGIVVDRLDASLTRLLLDHSDALRVRQEATVPGTGASGGQTARETLRAVLEATAARHLPAMLREVAAEHEKELIARAAVASASESAACERELAVFEQGRAALLAALAARVDELVQRLGVPGDAPQATKTGAKRELTLMDEGDLDSWLAVSDLVHTLETELGAPLAALHREHARLAAAEGGPIPFAPEALGGLFHDLPQDVGIGSGERTPFVKVAGRVLSGRLGAFYEDLAEHLRRLADDLPDAAAAPVQMHEQVAERTYTAAEVVEALAVLQRRSPGGSAWLATDAIATDVARVLECDGSTADSGLGAQIEERLELAQHLLESIYRDLGLPTAAVAWLARLKLPLFGAAVDRPAFHREAAHPLARVAERLGRLGMLIGDGETGPDAETREAVNAVMAGLLDRGLPEATDLERASEALSALEDREAAGYQARIARIAAECEAEGRIEVARQEVARTLERRFAGRPLPALLVELVEEAWEVLLQLSHIRSGGDGAEWGDLWRILDELEGLLDAPPGTAPPEAVARLLDSVDRGLARASFDPGRRSDLRHRLGQRFTEQPAGASWAPPPPALLTAPRPGGEPATPPEEAADPTQGIDDAAWGDLLERVAALQAGDALTLEDPSGARRLRRVAWIDDRGWRHVLADHRGARAETLNRRQIAGMLQAGTAHIAGAGGTALLDRAAQGVVDALAQRLAEDAWHEPALGVYNRRYLARAIGRAMRASRSTGRRPAVVMVELDLLGPVADAHGAGAADRLLRDAAALLEDRFGSPAVVARIAEDTFAVLQENAEAAGVVAAAESLRVRIRELPGPWDAAQGRVGASVGVAFAHPLHDEADQVLEAAAAACAAARAAGRNQVAVHRDDEGRLLRNRPWLQSVLQLHESLEQDRLRLRIRPVAPVLEASDRRGYHEVLLGVVGPDGADLPLRPFLKAAENYNRMAILDQAVIRKALNWSAEHPAEVERLGGLAISLSADSLGDPRLIGLLTQAFRETGAEPRHLCFGIKEEVAAADLDHVEAVLAGIKDLGCRLALLEFGGATASTARLLRLPVDRVAIDGTLVRQLPASDRDCAAVKSINAMCHFLGRDTVAPQVEDDAVLACLRRVGVDYALGAAIGPSRELGADGDDGTLAPPDLAAVAASLAR
ncbi:MAG: DUF1631 family protein [Gammaproteobacteria bacterium]|nr:DUF1631 family protein [Gammaproteobacteria bacterium]